MKHQKAIKAKGDQESVWDYPRPPVLDKINSHITVYFAGEKIASTNKAIRYLETSHPPTIYIPIEDIRTEFLKDSSHSSYCEWKGMAKYYDLAAGDIKSRNAAWYYPSPKAKYGDLTNHLAFYPSKMEVCYIDGEKVESQEGDFYGGWITSKIVGPFKGGQGTFGW